MFPRVSIPVLSIATLEMLLVLIFLWLLPESCRLVTKQALVTICL